MTTTSKPSTTRVNFLSTTTRVTLTRCASPEYKLDWEALREKVGQYGLRNSTLSAQMPSESSSVVCNATNGIEPPRDYLSIKKSKKGTSSRLFFLPNPQEELHPPLGDMEFMEGYLNVMAVIQKFFDQSISTNTSYNPQHFEGKEVPACPPRRPAQVLSSSVLRLFTIRTPTTVKVKKRLLRKRLHLPSMIR